MILPPDFEARTVDTVRRLTDDIVECERATIRVDFAGEAPIIEFIFQDPRLKTGSPMLGVQMIAYSRKNPLAAGRIVEGDELRRHVRDSVEQYFKMNGLAITKKVVQNACL